MGDRAPDGKIVGKGVRRLEGAYMSSRKSEELLILVVWGLALHHKSTYMTHECAHSHPLYVQLTYIFAVRFHASTGTLGTSIHPSSPLRGPSRHLLYLLHFSLPMV